MEAEFRMKNSKLVEFEGMEPVLRNCKNVLSWRYKHGCI